MNYYVSTPTGRECLALCRERRYREMACPVKTRKSKDGGREITKRSTTVHLDRYALDNGAWLFHTIGSDADFQPFIDALVTIGPRADFVVAPDIVAGGADSLRLSTRWLPWCLMHSRLALIPVQDGMHPEDVAAMVGERVGIFVGGSLEWKWTTVASWARFAELEGIYIHVGRVNSDRKARRCADLGVHSCDGSTVAQFPRETCDRMVKATQPNRPWQGHLL